MRTNFVFAAGVTGHGHSVSDPECFAGENHPLLNQPLFSVGRGNSV